MNEVFIRFWKSLRERSRYQVLKSLSAYEVFISFWSLYPFLKPLLVFEVVTVVCFLKFLSVFEACINFWNLYQVWESLSGGGNSTFFQVGVCGPDFRSVGLANWHLPLKRGACERKISKFGGLWAENFQIWGLVSWKFPNLGACELKFGWKIEAVEAKIS